MKNPKETYQVYIHCQDAEGKIGCFVKNTETGEQVTPTFKNSFVLFSSSEYRDLKIDLSLNAHDPEDVYLEYIRKWLTVGVMAEHYQMSKDELFLLIDRGRKRHLNRIGRFDLELLCNNLKNEVTGLNKIVCEDAIRDLKFTDLILTFGQQAAEDAPESMAKFLSKKTFSKLCQTYKQLKKGCKI